MDNAGIGILLVLVIGLILFAIMPADQLPEDEPIIWDEEDEAWVSWDEPIKEDLP